MKINEIDSSDEGIYAWKTPKGAGSAGTLSIDYKSIIADLPAIESSFEKFKNAKSPRDKTYIKSAVGSLMNRIYHILELCDGILANKHDQDAIAIQNKLNPIFDKLEQMYNSIK
jgi:hypothetical protein